jgi:hypothetical protein
VRWWGGLACGLAAAGCGPDGPVSVPDPSGALGVGRVTLRWQDPDRPETMTDRADDPRELTVHLWYPADAAPPAAAAPYVPDLTALAPVLEQRTVQAFQRVQIHARPGAPPAQTPDRLPLVIVSPGNDMFASQYTFLIEDLVSHGYLVAALDHPYDARAALLADGSAVAFAGARWPAPPPPDASGLPDEGSAHARFYQERVGVRADDARLVLQRAAEGALAAAVSGLADRLDRQRVAFVGHSVGGVAAGEVCRREPSIRACVNLDGESPNGPYYREPTGPSFAQPYLMLTKPFLVPDEQLSRWGLDRPTWEARLKARQQEFFGSLPGGSHRVAIEGAVHASFSDDPFVFAALAGDAAQSAHLDRMSLIRQVLRAFLGQHLRGESAAALLEALAQPGVAAAESWPTPP